MSEPTPRILPFMAMRAPSPPEEPPHVRVRFRGLTVRPNTVLYVSDHCKMRHIYNDLLREGKCTDHQRLWHIRANIRYGATLVEDISDDGVLCSGLSDPRDIACSDIVNHSVHEEIVKYCAPIIVSRPSSAI